MLGMSTSERPGGVTAHDLAASGPPPAGEQRPLPDFADTEQTFRHLSDAELAEAGRLFALMGRSWLTTLLSHAGALAVKARIPGVALAVRRTIYRQFVGGVDLNDAAPRITRLFERGVSSILDYGAEAKSDEADFDRFVAEVRRAIHFGQHERAACAVVVKVTGIAPNEVLEEANEERLDFQKRLDPRLEAVVRRLETISAAAAEGGTQLYIDAEESWFQNTIDQLADEMMRRHNTRRVVVLNTFQMYRHDRLEFLRASDERARNGAYLLGAKLVRGAYMDKERARAKELGFPSPIQPNLQSTHRDFDAAVRYCLERAERIATTIGTHNEASTMLGARLVDEQGLRRDHPHVRFAQLLGMSDNLTFNLAAAGYNAAKYVVYGPVREVLPYLVRRAQENTSVTGEMGRELALLQRERRRRRG
jgi:proline dehydrogenase